MNKLNLQNRHAAWTARKFAFVGVMVAAMLVFWGIAKLILVVGFGLPNASPANLFTLPLLAALSMLMLKERGAMVFPILIFSILAIPLPALGGPGFLLKVPILVIPFIVAEHLFWLLKKRPDLAATASGALAGSIIGYFLGLTFGGEAHAALFTFDIFGVNIASFGAVILGMFEGGVGGLAAHGIYTRIRNNKTIQQILKSQDLLEPMGDITAPSSNWRRVAFSVIVLTYLVWLAIVNALMFLPVLGLLPDNALSAMKHFGDFISTGDTHNLIHELVFAFIIGTAGVGLLSQLWKPKENYAGQWVAMIAWGVMILIAAITDNWVPQPLYLTFGGLTLIATFLHPAGRDLFRWLRTPRINKALLILVAVATIPFLFFAVENINLQRGGAMNQSENGGAFNFFGHQIPQHGGDNLEVPSENSAEPGAMTAQEEQADHDMEHISVGHYRSMAAFSFMIILLGLLASLRPSGWRFAAWTAGLLAALFGIASIVLPEAESSLGLGWGFASTIWGIAFIAVGESVRRKELKAI